MMTDAEYHDHELRRAYAEGVKKGKEFRALPRFEREHEVGYLVEHITEGNFIQMMGWILEGSFGYGVQWHAERTIKSDGRNNKRAQLFYLTALHAFSVPYYYANKAWKQLTEAQRETLNGLIDQEIEYRLEVLKEIAEFEAKEKQEREVNHE